MKLMTNLPAFVAGFAVVVLVHGLRAGVDAQPETEDVIEVCANAEGVMRLTAPAVSCNPGERRVTLKKPDLEKPCEEPPKTDVAGLQRRLTELENHVSDRLLTSPVVAPFEVVNEAGIRVFAVQEPHPGLPDLVVTEISNDVGTRVASITANSEGGSLTVESGDRAPVPGAPDVSGSPVSATIRARGTDVGVEIRDSEPRIALGRADTGRYRLAMLGADRKMVAGIGQSEAGSGIILVADKAGNPKVRMSRDSASGSGLVAVINGQDRAVATLSGNGPGNSGLLQITNDSGTVMVEAGVTEHGVGRVLAGPGAFQHGIGFLGLPGSYIVGKK